MDAGFPLPRAMAGLFFPFLFAQLLYLLAFLLGISKKSAQRSC